MRNLALHVCTYLFYKLPCLLKDTNYFSSHYSCVLYLFPSSMLPATTIPWPFSHLPYANCLLGYLTSFTISLLQPLVTLCMTFSPFLHDTPKSSGLDVGGQERGREGGNEKGDSKGRCRLVFTLQTLNLVKVVSLFVNSSDIMGFQRMCSYSWYASLLFPNKKVAKELNIFRWV